MRGHYCKICGEYKSNEKFSGKGHAAHICKACASLPLEKKSEIAAINRLLNLPWRLSKEQISWLNKKMCHCQRTNQKYRPCQPSVNCLFPFPKQHISYLLQILCY